MGAKANSRPAGDVNNPDVLISVLQSLDGYSVKLRRKSGIIDTFVRLSDCGRASTPPIEPHQLLGYRIQI